MTNELSEGTSSRNLGFHTEKSGQYLQFWHSRCLADLQDRKGDHNITNTGSVPLKLYTLYAPPNHRDGVVHRPRADTYADHEHFDGKTTE